MGIGAKIYGSIYLRGFKVWISYRTQVLLNILGYLLPVFTFFFVGLALGKSVQVSSGVEDYTAFFVAGLAFQPFMTATVSSFSYLMNSSAVNGTIEYFLLTPAGLLRSTLWGATWSFLLSILFAVLTIIVGEILGANFSGADILGVLILTVLLLVSGIGVGLISGGVVLLTKAGDPVQFFFGAFSTLLSGTVFPIAVMPVYLKYIVYSLPLTWALMGIRGALISGESIEQIGSIILVLLIFDFVTIVLGILSFEACFHFARKKGILTEF